MCQAQKSFTIFLIANYLYRTWAKHVFTSKNAFKEVENAFKLPDVSIELPRQSLEPENMGKTAAYFQQLRVLLEADAPVPAGIALNRRNGT